MFDGATTTETEHEVSLCRACGYVLADCVTHKVHPSINLVEKVPRKSEAHVRALSSFFTNTEKWKEKERAEKALSKLPKRN